MLDSRKPDLMIWLIISAIVVVIDQLDKLLWRSTGENAVTAAWRAAANRSASKRHRRRAS